MGKKKAKTKIVAKTEKKTGGEDQAKGKARDRKAAERSREFKSPPVYSEAFKNKVIRELQLGRSVSEVLKEYPGSDGTVRRWVRQREKETGKPLLRFDGKPVLEKHGSYTAEERAEAVAMVVGGKSVREVSEEREIPNATLRRWINEDHGGMRVITGEKEAKEASARLEAGDEKDEQAMQAYIDAEQNEAERVREMMADSLVWMQRHTKTKDSHWREHHADSPHSPFPDKPYFHPLLQGLQDEPVIFIEKSRDMMLSWLTVAFFTHAAMTTEGIQILFQSQKDEKACELVEYARILYEHSDPAIKRAYPLTKKSSGELLFSNGSRIIAIPGGADQVRSYHPWGLLMDEAAFMPEACDSYNNAVPVCKKIVALSSAGPGWFADVCSSAVLGKELVRGVVAKRAAEGLVFRVHYTADQQRDPARNPAWIKRERRKYSSQSVWDREQEIIHEAGGGERLFAEVLSRWGEKILIDPEESGFRPSPFWKRVGGFDHGKANPTAALVGCMDQDGILYILGEYYQPGLSPRQHRPNLQQLKGFTESEVYADPSIFYETQAQSDGTFKAIADLYIEDGITNLVRAPNNNELTGMERILKHWLDLDRREPTLKIVCPRYMREIARPVYGVCNDGCPNLLWELKRARREELSAGQLVTKNPTEKIVDKDNHLRDCLKYIVSAFLEPETQSPHAQALEAIKDIPREDVTSRMIRYQDAVLAAEEQNSAPYIPLGRRGRYLLGKRTLHEQFRMRNRFRDPGERG